VKKSDKTFTPEELVEMGKLACDISKPNGELDDAEIRLVMRWVGRLAPDCQFLYDKVEYGPKALGLMIFVTEIVFPEFYNRYELGPRD
jgi:hypothetical protein